MEENQPVPLLPAPSGQTVSEKPKLDPQSQKNMIIALVVVMVIIILLVAATVWMLTASTETTAKVRDVFIIFMALESLVIGVALVVLVVQLATLINLLQNEIKPIINTTNETVNTLRGTVVFLSENLSEPVIKMNSYLAGLKQFFEVIRPGRTKR
jgi:hypothetical protein